jgi:ribonuclease P protein component
MLKKTVLRRKSDFALIYKKGKSVPEKYIVFFVRKNELSYNRTAFLASKKVGNSVTRNRARRLMKESYRELKENLAIGYDIIFIARNTICNSKCADVKKSMEAAVKRAGVFEKKSEKVNL